MSTGRRRHRTSAASGDAIEWVRQAYRRDPDLKRRIDTAADELLVVHDLVVLRKERGLSQRELAALVGVTQPQIARIESGSIRSPGIQIVARMAAALGARLKIQATGR